MAPSKPKPPAPKPTGRRAPGREDPESPDAPTRPSARRTWAFRLVALTLIPAAVLVAGEMALRLFGCGYRPEFVVPVAGRDAWRGNRLFGRRFFPAALAREPMPFAFPAEKPPGTYRIFVLGGSAAAGTPNEAFGLAQVLAAMLRQRRPDLRFEVVNAAMTGINSHVVHVIAQDCADHQGDLFVVYMGHNEIIGPYGPGTVFADFSGSLWAIRASIVLRATRTGQLLSRLLADGRAGRRWKGMELFVDSRVDADDPRLADAREHYRANLRDICATAGESGAPIVLCTAASNLRHCPPFASMHRAGLDENEQARFAAISVLMTWS